MDDDYYAGPSGGSEADGCGCLSFSLFAMALMLMPVLWRVF